MNSVQAFEHINSTVRRTHIGEIYSVLGQDEGIRSAVLKIIDNSKKLILKTKGDAEDKNLSEQEVIIKNFLSKNDFGLTANRMIADFVTELCSMYDPDAKIVAHKFLNFKKEGESLFDKMPSWFAVIPTGSSNDHHYRLGNVAIRTPIQPRGIFIKSDGTDGDIMTQRRDELDIPTELHADDIVKTILRAFYYQSSLMEYFCAEFYSR